MARRTFPKDGGERIPIQTRTTTSVRDRLEEAARNSGRSLAQEMEMRLERSLSIKDAAEKTAEKTLDYLSGRDEVLLAMIGGRETLDLALDIVFLVSGVEADQDQRWFESPELRADIYKVLESALPELLRAPRTGERLSPFMRAVNYAKYLPNRAQKPAPEMTKAMRFMTDDERKQFFHLNDDNA